jgi:hypothetical protein
MAFLPNNGSIILDAVLTDEGRARLARGDNSFKIVKFSLADDEIDYTLYNSNHASGSAYADIEILQSPVMEAWTDNAASMKYKLISIPRDNLLYLPVVKLNNVFDAATAMHALGTFIAAVDKNTQADFNASSAGILMTETPDSGGSYVRIDQGLDTSDISPNRALDNSLVETQYIVSIDSRLGEIVSKSGRNQARPSFIDDDNIAYYFFSLGTDIDFVSENTITDADNTSQVIAGPRGTYLEFKLFSSLELNTSTSLFTELGTTGQITNKLGGQTDIYYIDSFVSVTGATTGRKIDVPVRWIRKQ